MRILLIEDEETLCQNIALQLKHNGYLVDYTHDGEEGLLLATEGVYDMILLDRMLPSMDGITVLTKLRSQGIGTPVILITALSHIGDKVTGLDAGADDYLSKPFETAELLARIRALSRRPVDWQPTATIQIENTTLDPRNLTLAAGEDLCSLSKKEALLFEVFMKSPNTALPRGHLLSRVWGPDAMIEEGNLDNYIHFLRRRLRTIHSSLTIKTIRGIGYMLEASHV